jgi:hypothetical protein
MSKTTLLTLLTCCVLALSSSAFAQTNSSRLTTLKPAPTKMVFGLTIGGIYNVVLPKCRNVRKVSSDYSEDCEAGRSLDGRNNGAVSINLTRDKTGSLVNYKFSDINLTLSEGILTEISWITNGVNGDADMMQSLEYKFGKTADYNKYKVGTTSGNILMTSTANWKFSDLQIEYYGLPPKSGDLDIGAIKIKSVVAAAKQGTVNSQF